MRSKAKGLAALAIMMACVFCMPAVPAQAAVINELISLSPGENQTREFVLYNVFDIKTPGPAQSYVIICSGDNETKAGKLTITLTTTAKKDFGSYVDYSMMGFGYSLGGTPAFISAAATTPWPAEKVLTLNSTFGFAFVSAMIRGITGDVELPAPFTMVFKLSVAE
jgi:hypothetical protein